MTIDPIDLLPPIPDPNECRRRAIRCERIAVGKTAEGEKEAMLTIAQHWRTMANAVEKESGHRSPAA